jgi:hypothetical protein
MQVYPQNFFSADFTTVADSILEVLSFPDRQMADRVKRSQHPEFGGEHHGSLLMQSSDCVKLVWFWETRDVESLRLIVLELYDRLLRIGFVCRGWNWVQEEVVYT